MAAQTVVHLSGNPAIKKAILDDNNPELMDNFFETINSLIVSNRGDKRADGLEELAKLMERDGSIIVDQCNQRLFGKVGGERERSVSLVFKYAKMPFEDVSVKAYELLLMLVKAEWGIREVNNEVSHQSRARLHSVS